jgi:ABC-type branched-subunit amino acid transport system ATPase component/ABC-type branched-subunit amino acid transport system permease subunit
VSIRWFTPQAVRVRLAPAAAVLLITALATPALLDVSGGDRAALTLSLASQALLLATIATSWNVVCGYLGYIDLGHVAYFGLGAYGAGMAVAVMGWGFLAALVAGTALAGTIAAVAGVAILRLRGATFAIATLGLLVTIREIVGLAGPLTGGGRGLVLLPPPPTVIYYTAIALFAAAVMLSWRLRHTSLWPVLLAIREDEQAAAARGLPTMAWRHTIYTAAAAVTGAAGSLWAYQSTFIDPDLAFANTRSLDMITAALLGGLGTVIGPVLGAVILFIGRALVWLPSDASEVLLQGLVLIAIVRWLPRGIFGRLGEERTGEDLLVRSLDHGRQAHQAALPSSEPASPAAPVRTSATAAPLTRSVGGSVPDLAARPTTDDPLLEVRGLRMRSSGATLLDRIDLTARSGEILGVVGPNGSGKTTLVDCLSRFQPLDAGTITLAGRNVTRESPQQIARSGIGRTFQVRRVYGPLTAADNLLLCTRWTLRGVSRRTPDPVTQHVQSMLTRLGLDAFSDTAARELTADQQRLLEVGMALMLDPKVLVLDEATAGVDHAVVATIKAVARGCADEGRAVIVVEHDIRVAADLCHRVVVLDRGQVVAEGTPASVLSSRALETAYFGADEG